jgi:hypothetical protein
MDSENPYSYSILWLLNGCNCLFPPFQPSFNLQTGHPSTFQPFFEPLA